MQEKTKPKLVFDFQKDESLSIMSGNTHAMVMDTIFKKLNDNVKIRRYKFINGNAEKILGLFQYKSNTLLHEAQELIFERCGLDNDTSHFFLNKDNFQKLEQLSLIGNNYVRIPIFHSDIQLKELVISHNHKLQKINEKDFVKQSIFKGLEKLDQSENRIQFESGNKIEEFVKKIVEIKSLKHLQLQGNSFCNDYPQYKNYFFRDFYLLYEKSPSNYKHLEGFELDGIIFKSTSFGLLFNTNKHAWRDWRDITKEHTPQKADSFDKPISKQGSLKNFREFLTYIERSLWNPSESTHNLNQLKSSVEEIAQHSQAGIFFENTNGKLQEDVDSFMLKVNQQVDSQDEIHYIVVEIISKLTYIKQEDIGKKCYEKLNALARKGSEFKKIVKKFLIENCISHFKVNNIHDVYENHMQAFVEVVNSNQYSGLFDDSYIVCLVKWLTDILIHELEISDSGQKSILFNAKITSSSTFFSCIFDFVNICIRQTFQQKPIFYQQQNILMTMFIKIRTKRYLREFFQTTFYLDMIRYVTTALKYFVKGGGQGKKYLARQLLDTGRFFSEILQELDDLKNEIIVNLNNDMAGQKGNYIEHLETSFESVLMMIVEFQKASDRPTNINDEIYIRNANSSESIFYDIPQMYNLNDNLSYYLKATIIKFCYKTLNNENLITVPLKDSEISQNFIEHRPYVKNITEFLNDLKDSTEILKFVKEDYKNEQIMRCAIAMCKLYLFYKENAIEKVEHDRNHRPAKELQEGLEEEYSYQENNRNLEVKEKKTADYFIKPWGNICDRVVDLLDAEDLDNILLEGLEIESDDYKYAIVNVLNMSATQFFNKDEINRLASKFSVFKNVGSGRNEKILGTMYLCLTKIIKYADRKLIIELLSEKGNIFIEEAVEILGKNHKRDVRINPDEQNEKDQLTVCINQFLKVITEGMEELNKQDNNADLNTKSLFVKVKAIIKNEYHNNPKMATASELERSVLRRNSLDLIKFMNEPWKMGPKDDCIEVKANSYVYFRMLNHLADLVGEYMDPWFNNHMHDHFITNKQTAQQWKIHHIVELNEEWKKMTVQNELLLPEMTKMVIKKRKPKDNCKIQDNFDNIIEKFEYDIIYNNITADFHIMDILYSLSDQIEEYYNPISKVRTDVIVDSENQESFFKSNIYEDYKKAEVIYKGQVEANKYEKKSNFMKDFGAKKGSCKLSLNKNRLENYCNQLKFNKAESENQVNVEKSYLHPLTPDHIKRSSKLKAVDLKDYINADYGEIDFEKKMLMLSTCAYLRFLDNILTKLPRAPEDNIKNILAILNKDSFVRKLVFICDKVGWSEGFVACKFQTLIKKIVYTIFYLQRNDQNKVDDFREKLEIYGIIFKSIDKVLIYFQNRLSSHAQVVMSWEDLYTILYQSTTCYEIIDSIKKLIINSGDEDEIFGESLYRIHDKQHVTKAIIVERLLRNYFPLSYMYTFILCLLRITVVRKSEKDITKLFGANSEVNDAYTKYTQYKSKNDIETEIRAVLRDLISEYMCIMPKTKYIITKYFYDIEVTLGSRSCNCLVAEIQAKSRFYAKQTFIKQYLKSKSIMQTPGYLQSMKNKTSKLDFFKKSVKSDDIIKDLVWKPFEKEEYAGVYQFSTNTTPQEDFEVCYILCTSLPRIFILQKNKLPKCNSCPTHSLCPEVPKVAFCLKPGDFTKIYSQLDKRSVVIVFNKDKVNSPNLIIDFITNIQREKFMLLIQSWYSSSSNFDTEIYERKDKFMLQHLNDLPNPFEKGIDKIYCGILNDDSIYEDLNNGLTKSTIFSSKKKIFIIFKEEKFKILEIDSKLFDIESYTSLSDKNIADSIKPEKNIFKKLKQLPSEDFTQSDIEELRFENTTQANVDMVIASTRFSFIQTDNNERENFKRYLSNFVSDDMERLYKQDTFNPNQKKHGFCKRIKGNNVR